MTGFVLDSSVALSWFFEDEKSEATDRLLERLETETAAVPALWYFEVANVLALGEQRGRVTAARSSEIIAQIEGLTIVVDASGPARTFHGIFDLARSERLTAYDASYLELAMRLGVPLATKDGDLASAAARLGVAVLGAD